MRIAIRESALFGLAFLTFIVLLYYFKAEERLTDYEKKYKKLIKKSKGHLISYDDNDIIIFNKIPKTASTTFMHVPYELCSRNKYNVLLVDVQRSQHYFSHMDALSFARNITQWSEKHPALYHGHFAFIDFQKFGAYDPHPIYINLVRQPLERLVSYYYFLRYGDNFRVNKIRSKMGDTTSFDECVRSKLPDCDPKKLWLQIPWFCGSAKKCWEPGNKWALEQAKHNLVHKYFLVGVTEDLEGFIRILERSIPRFFMGATDIFLSSEEAQHIRQTKKKIPPSDDVQKLMQATKIWKMEHEFYEFAKSQYEQVKQEFEQSKPDGVLFKYEKIRPRN